MTFIRSYRNRGLLMATFRRRNRGRRAWKVECHYASDHCRRGWSIRRTTFWKALRLYVALWAFPATCEGTRGRNPRKTRRSHV